MIFARCWPPPQRFLSALANARSETDPRGTYPLHVAAEFNQPAAAQLLLDYGADVSLLDKSAQQAARRSRSGAKRRRFSERAAV
jgi:ankyrin repeat protein